MKLSSMSLLPAPINQVLHPNHIHSIRDRRSPSMIPHRYQDRFYSHPGGSPQNADPQDVCLDSTDQNSDRAKKTRKFVCQYCGRKFLRAEHLRRHEITHTGNKPYRCPYCQEAFSRSDILKRHMVKCRAASGSEHVLVDPEASNVPLRRACDRCARLKVRCDFAQPCSRCGRQQMDCTYYRLNTNKSNVSSDERRSSQVSLNGIGPMPRLQLQDEETSMNGVDNMNHPTETFPLFDGSYPLGQTQSVSSPHRMLRPLQTMGIYGLQHSSPQGRLNHISPPNQPIHKHTNSNNGLSTFNMYPVLQAVNNPPMDLSTNHQYLFSQNLDIDNLSDTHDMFASSGPSDIIFDNQFSSEDTFHAWKPFEYSVRNDVSLDFLFGSDLSFDIGFSPNDPKMGEPRLPYARNAYLGNSNKENEEVPDEVLVATFDRGTGQDREEIVARSDPSLEAHSRLPNELLSGCLHLIQIDPLQARVDALSIAVFGSLEVLQKQVSWIVEFFSKESIKNMLFLWSKRWAHRVPIIHLPTFSILSAPDSLLFILCVIGKAYSRPGIEAERLQWCVNVFTKLSCMARVNGELDMVNLEAVFILAVLCTWHGNKQQRDMARRLHREVVNMVRKYGYCRVFSEGKTDGSGEAEWKAWIERETRIRFMMNVYLLDGGYVMFFNTRPALQYREMELPFPCDAALWAAPTATAWRNEMQKHRERAWFPHTLDTLIRASLRAEDDPTDLFGKLVLIHGLINHIWEKQAELDCRTDLLQEDIIRFRTSTTLALNNWRQLWDHMIPRLKMDCLQWARLGNFRNSLEYWYAAKLFLAQPRRAGWGQPYDDDNNLFRVKRMLRMVRLWIVGGESKPGTMKWHLRVPNFVETLKVVIPELANVRIEETPSVVPGPERAWKSSENEEKH